VAAAATARAMVNVVIFMRMFLEQPAVYQKPTVCAHPHVLRGRQISKMRDDINH
jgi:hypothetical protein